MTDDDGVDGLAVAATDLRRFVLYITSDDRPASGEALGVGVQFPDDTVVLHIPDEYEAVTFDDLGTMGTHVGRARADGPGNDTWVEFEDDAPDADREVAVW